MYIYIYPPPSWLLQESNFAILGTLYISVYIYIVFGGFYGDNHRPAPIIKGYHYDVERPSFIEKWKIIRIMKKTNKKRKKNKQTKKTTPKKKQTKKTNKKQNKNNKNTISKTHNNKQRTV